MFGIIDWLSHIRKSESNELRMYKYQPSFYFIHKTFPIDVNFFNRTDRKKTNTFLRFLILCQKRKKEKLQRKKNKMFHNIDDANI